MNKKIIVPLLILTLIAISVIPITTIKAAAQTTTGKPVTQITWKVRLNREAAILEVADGKADIFTWTSPLPQYQGLDPAVLGKLKLIRSASTYVSIAINPAANVIDPNAPGKVQLLHKSYVGQQIPGLIYWNPPKGNWINITSIKNYNNLHFNPFALREVRFALNFLIDRDLIVRSIYGGSATPAFGAVMPSNPGAYERLKNVYTELGLTPSGNKKLAVKLFMDAMKRANETLKKYHMMLVLKPDSSSPTGKFWYFVKPDGSSEPITVYFVIRIEDQRLYIGRQIATWIEQYWNLKVVRIERERSVVTPVIYGSNPVTTSSRLGNIVWTLYTEGWVNMGEEIDVYARYDVAFFYAPVQGYGPNSMNTKFWYWYNATMYKLGVDLNYGSFTQKTINKLWKEIRELLYDGVWQSPRVFVTLNYEYAPVCKARVTQLVPGVVTGIWTLWALRTLKTVDGKATLVEYSSQGALFMSAWNPVLGFTGVYSMLMGGLVMDWAFYSSPINGMPVPIRVKGYKVLYNVTVPNDAYVYNSSIGVKKWVVSPDAGKKVAAEVIVNYNLGKWHDGNPVTLADIIYTYGFYWEWSHDDSKGNVTDPYYDPEIDSSMSYTMSQIKGIRIINSTAIAIYTSYLDVYPVLIAQFVTFWPQSPWYVMSAAEQLVAHAKVPTGGTLPYGWTSRAGKSVGISFINPVHAKDIMKEMEKLKSEGYVPPYIKTFPGLTGYSLSEYDAGIKFIQEYNNAMISNGPFYVASYNPNSRVLVMKWFKDYVYPPGYWNTKFELYQPAFVGFKPAPPSLVIAGKSYSWNVELKLYRLLPSFAVEEPTKATIYVKLYKVTSNGTKYVATLPEDAVKLVKPGVYSITLPADFTAKYMSTPGAYIIQLIIGHPKSGIAIIKNVELTSLGAITTTSTSTSPTTTTTTTTTTSTVVSTTTVSGTVTIATTKIITTTKTATVTSTSTLVKTSTVPTTITQRITTTNWGAVAAAAIILFIIGLIIGYAAKRK